MRLPRFTPQLRRRILAHLALSFVSLSFGGLNVLSRVALAPSPAASPSASSAHPSASFASPGSPAPATVHPIALGVCRDCGAFPILLLAYTLSQRARSRPLWRPRRSDMVLLAGCGVAGLYGNQILYVIGASLTSADLVSFYTATNHEGKNALHLAAGDGALHICRFLLRHGKLNFERDAVGRAGV